ncbi:class I SAM-dependent methyltransferase [Desulfovibrio gilichinskyi]|uniref:Methyltransferase domain-containing protein n=1 Tax=Desulfovibrio gilichinskyi TaxID=1519643 RepID=A0A1X7EA52_9BACT|nr:class I SAM-dependent methyltransferase [Desulfovibrio gilichinskyi]SMF30423.1 Methyltransferase domain-containing protein [Desulfovibrio gilichinskyi]
MGNLLNLITPLHKSTTREYLPRMMDEKVECMLKAKVYEFDYWDGDRRYGYGGYSYKAGYWAPIAQGLIDHYSLKKGSKILDVGCGKAYLLYELYLLGMDVLGFDISRHGLGDAKEEIRDKLFVHRAEYPFPFADNEFDLVISVNTLHNLQIFDLKNSLQEMERVGKRSYMCTESYRNELEQFNLQCWALTCESFFDKDEWVWVFNEFGFTGDYEFIYFE